MKYTHQWLHHREETSMEPNVRKEIKSKFDEINEIAKTLDYLKCRDIQESLSDCLRLLQVPHSVDCSECSLKHCTVQLGAECILKGVEWN